MRRSLEPLFVIACLALAIAPAQADDYPSRRITLIAPWPPAGAIDTVCRELAPGVGDLLGQPVVVENRPGAGSTIGTADGATPDGYTLVLAGSGSMADQSRRCTKSFPMIRGKILRRSRLSSAFHSSWSSTSLPINSVADLISYAKAHPGALTYGSGGAGSPHQLFAEMFKTMTGIEMTHVPYKGSAPALTDVIGGHIALLFADPAPALPLIKAGKVRALGVTSAVPLPAAPDIPPLAQRGVPGFDAAGWGMVAAPAHTPAAIVSKLYNAFRTVESRSEVRERLIFLGLTPQTSPPPEALQGFIDAELVRWGKVVKSAGLAATQ